jgi:glycosyltransferase involved in cell wall biosynthesis
MGTNYNPLVSIGIPTYNRASGYLRDAIERSLGQTYRNIEVIVSDNCSSDKTPELVRSYTDPRLRYFRQQSNIGANNNFNYCLNQARGEYFLLYHDDDVIDDDFIEACVTSLKNGAPVGAVFTGVRVIDEHGTVREEHRNSGCAHSPADFIEGWFRGEISLYLCNTMYNTKKLKEMGGFRSLKNLFDDLVPTFTLVSRYGHAVVADIKAGFRRHSSNRGATISIHDWTADCLYLLDVICRLLPGNCTKLRMKGNYYFCKKMYNYLANGSAASTSLLDYLRVYRSFDYCYSPLRFFFRRKFNTNRRKSAEN